MYMDLRTNLQYVYGLKYKTPSTKLEVLKVLKTEGARARTHTHTHTHLQEEMLLVMADTTSALLGNTHKNSHTQTKSTR